MSEDFREDPKMFRLLSKTLKLARLTNMVATLKIMVSSLFTVKISSHAVGEILVFH